MTQHSAFATPRGSGSMMTSRWISYALLAACAVILGTERPRAQQEVGAAVLDPDLTVTTVIDGLTTPTGMAFIGRNDMLVLEKATGRVVRVTNGAVQSAPALDLAVNSASERGLLGIALHPRFPRDRGVYLFWTESTVRDANGNALDTDDVTATPLLGNRVDRFVWDGSRLTFEKNLIRIRAFQHDSNQQPRGNHNGGVIRFELDRRDNRSRGDDDVRRGDDDVTAGADEVTAPDRGRNEDRGRDDDPDKAKLFIIVGDEGRRGQLQNLEDGPIGPGNPDDQFGGPEPDPAHLTGVILRVNDDGTTPRDNPFYNVGRRVGGPVGASLQKVFAYGIRNSFGMAVDPMSGNLWNQENGDDSFDEINRITAGQNNGWVQVMGPLRRVDEFKTIETSAEFFGLQQLRWPPTNIAETPIEAFRRLVMLPGSHYRDPLFSWKHAIAPAAIGFLNSRALGREYEGDLFVGASAPRLDGGYLMRFDLSRDRARLNFTDRRLADRVADNETKHDATESESLRFGTGFGVTTEITTGPDGRLYVVSLSNGAIYAIGRAR